VSGLAPRVFVDTNVLVYAHDSAAGERHATAKALLRRLWEEGTGALSTQVLQEFYAVATRKMKPPMDKAQARQIVADYSEWCVVDTDALLIVSASRLEEQHSLAFWDALIVEAALRAGVETLVSEDLQDGRVFANLAVRNPFRPGGRPQTWASVRDESRTRMDRKAAPMLSTPATYQAIV
jgi:predicted nucleic acid-binding protein